jgi:L-lactate dehydrogenase
MRAKIGIIGTGWVGSSVAISVLHTGVAGEVLLFDPRPGIAEGEAMDLVHGSWFTPVGDVRTGTVAEMCDCDAVVVTGGAAGKPGQTRLDLLQANARIIADLGEELRGATGMIVMVTNPVDIMTLVMQRASGLPRERVIGTGTMLDTARLRQVLGHELRLDPRSIHAQVVGEHGDSEVVLWSGVRVGGRSVRSWPGWDPARERALAETVRTAAYEIIRRKGATNHAIGLVTAALLKWALRDERRVLTVSRVQDAPGFEGVALSLPAVVGAHGAGPVVEPDLDDAERAALRHSADVLRRAAEPLGIA